MKQEAVQLHGGNIWALGRPVLDFSASLNPIGMPDAVAEAARRAVAESTAYPDPACTQLRRAISERDGVPAGQIFCGNGAADLLVRLALALRPRKAMVTAPTFGEYERALSVVGCRVLHHYLKAEKHFDVGRDLLRTVRPDLDFLILCNPNNPTGRAIEPEALQRMADFCERHRIWLMVDESFLPLTDASAIQEGGPMLASHPHLILLRSMTKTYSMPGLRLGYLLASDQGLLKQLERCGQPWSERCPGRAAIGKSSPEPSRMIWPVYHGRVEGVSWQNRSWYRVPHPMRGKASCVRRCAGFFTRTACGWRPLRARTWR